MTQREIVEALFKAKTGRKLNLDRPRGFNETVQWLKLYDQRPEQVTACDKIAARGMVAEILGPDVLVPLLDWPPTEFPCVAKCNHDSASREVLNGPDDVPAAWERLSARLAKPYGVDKGEWAYGRVKPQIMVERKLRDPIDFKVHCSGGEVRAVQIVTDILGKPREGVFLPDGRPTRIQTNRKFRRDLSVYPGDEAFSAVVDLARRVSQGWRFVRADFLWAEGKPWFSELTFWPRSGFFLAMHERAFGELVRIDLSSPTVVDA